MQYLCMHVFLLVLARTHTHTLTHILVLCLYNRLVPEHKNLWVTQYVLELLFGCQVIINVCSKPTDLMISPHLYTTKTPVVFISDL